jgi:type IV pilus assembly protein PilN
MKPGLSFSFNFLPHRVWEQAQRRRNFWRRLGGGAGLALIVLVIFHLGLSYQEKEQKQVQLILQAGILKLTHQTEDLSNVKPTLAEVNAHWDAIQTLQTDRNAAVNLLNQLLPILTPGLTLSKLSLTGLQVDLQGNAQRQIQVAELFHAMNESPAFHQVEWVDLARQEASEPPSPSSLNPAALLSAGPLNFSLRAHLRWADLKERTP